MSGPRNVRFIDDGAPNIGKYVYVLDLYPSFDMDLRQLCSAAQGGHLLPGKLQGHLVSIYQFYVTIAYFKFTATESSSGWSPPAQPHQLPMGNPMCIDTNEHSLPMVESPSSNGSDNSWSPPGALPCCELPPTSSPNCDTTPMPQTSCDSGSDTDTSEGSQGWTPPPVSTSAIPVQMYTQPSQTPASDDSYSSPWPMTPTCRPSFDSSDGDTSEESQGCTPPLQ